MAGGAAARLSAVFLPSFSPVPLVMVKLGLAIHPVCVVPDFSTIVQG
jgi:hypothetical protein